jgi:predicted transposase YdaD
MGEMLRRKEGKLESVPRWSSLNFTVERIAQVLDLTVEKVREIPETHKDNLAVSYDSVSDQDQV